MLDVDKITREIDALCDRGIENTTAHKMTWLRSMCFAFLSFAFTTISFYETFQKRKFYPLIVAAIFLACAYKFFLSGYRALLRAEKIKRGALKKIEEKFKECLDHTQPMLQPLCEEQQGIPFVDLVKRNAGTISSGMLIVTEVATGIPIHTVLKSVASFCIQQVANHVPEEKIEKTINPVVAAIFEIEFKRLILQATLECYERYIDECTKWPIKSQNVQKISLTTSITGRLKADLANELIKHLQRKNLIQQKEIKLIKEKVVPEILEKISIKLLEDADWVLV